MVKCAKTDVSGRGGAPFHDLARHVDDVVMRESNKTCLHDRFHGKCHGFQNIYRQLLEKLLEKMGRMATLRQTYHVACLSRGHIPSTFLGCPDVIFFPRIFVLASSS